MNPVDEKRDTTEHYQRWLLTLVFVLVIFGVGLIQIAVELQQGKRPGVAAVFRQLPSKTALRTFEKDLERDSWFSQAVRPWLQRLYYVMLNDAGEEALVGRDGWLFYKPGVHYLNQRPSAAGEIDAAVSAIVAFRDQLRARDIQLLVVPVPGKASIYPDKLTGNDASLAPPGTSPTATVVAALREQGVAVVDLSEVFLEARTHDDRPLYLAQDTHWTPQGMRLAVEAVSARLLALGWITQGMREYTIRSTALQRNGDILEMMQVPHISAYAVPEAIECTQVVDTQRGTLYEGDPASELLVLGDSFLRIYETDHPGSGGFIAHLAHALRMPLASIVNDGGASTLVRQELSRKPALLENKRVVVWEFVERDIRFGMEGWQAVPLP